MNSLFKYQDLKYREFHSKLINCETNLIGIRVPILKKIAKDNINTYKSFFKEKHVYYEEIMIHGLMLGYIKIQFEELTLLLDEFIPLINNWAINDSVCSNLKIFKKEQEKGFKYIKKLLQSNDEFKIRFGLVLLINHYINDNYIDKILDICNMNSDKYYINMALAWLLSYCYLFDSDKTIKIILKQNKFVRNKSIDKIRDSYRVNNNIKDYLKTLKI